MLHRLLHTDNTATVNASVALQVYASQPAARLLSLRSGYAAVASVKASSRCTCVILLRLCSRKVLCRACVPLCDKPDGTGAGCDL